MFSAAYAEDNETSYIEEAREITKLYQKALKSELQTAIQTGGFKNAIEVCHTRAPEIAQELNEQTGWEISRTSLKTRNHKNTPSSKEQAILEEFEIKKTDGAAMSELEWLEQEGQVVSYMKAIPVKGMCAACHGQSVNPTLKNHIEQYYPHDMATGFEVGDIRGAFTLKKYLKALNGQISE